MKNWKTALIRWLTRQDGADRPFVKGLAVSRFINEIKGIQKSSTQHKQVKGKVPSFKSLKLPKTPPPWGRVLAFRPLQFVSRHPIQISAAAAVLLAVFSFWFFTPERDSVITHPHTDTIAKAYDTMDDPVVQKDIQSVKPVKTKKKIMKKEEWCFAAAGALREQPLVAGSTIYFGSDDNLIYALDSQSGETRWQYRTGGRISSTPVLRDGFIYAASGDGFLYKLSSLDGSLSWKKEVGLLVLSRPYINEKMIYTASRKGLVMALDLNGNTVWQKQLDAPVYCSLEGDDAVLYFGASDGTVHAMTKAEGKTRWTFTTGSRIMSARPLVLEDRVLIGDTAGKLFALNKESGAELWSIKTGSQIVTAPVLYRDRIYAASDKVYCLSLDGRQKWSYEVKAVIQKDISIHNNVLTAIDNHNNIYRVHTGSGVCLEMEEHRGSILSYVIIDGRLYAGTDSGEICRIK